MSDICNDNEISAYMHCANCIDSPSKVGVGWTPQGLQVWCENCDFNIIHIDFQGAKHPANTTRKADGLEDTGGSKFSSTEDVEKAVEIMKRESIK